MTTELTPNERQVLTEQLLDGRDQWAERDRPALADWFNERLINLDDEATARRTEVHALDRQFAGLPAAPGVAEIIAED